MPSRQPGQPGQPSRTKHTQATKPPPPPIPPKTDREAIEPAKIIEALRRSKGMVSIAARLLDCSRQTVYSAMERHPEISEVVAGERELLIDTAELKLVDSVTKGQPWAIAFYLKTQGRHRGYIERREVDLEGRLTLEQAVLAARAKRLTKEKGQPA